ncbi:MAG: HigA family addiction module antidote protein [Steroidobacteraceae bacterium]|nr:HigA family addiction module antidote protein [Steroidobacteraceae bacterium]
MAGIQPQHAKRLRMQLAAKLGVAPSTLNRVLTGASGVSPEMALRLSKSLGRSPESWLAMQYSHDQAAGGPESRRQGSPHGGLMCRRTAIHTPVTRRPGHRTEIAATRAS